MRKLTYGIVAAACAGVAALPAAATAAPGGHTITVSTTIQAAVDAAQPGDTIVVPAGVYRENVTVRTAGLTIVGRPGAVLDGEGLAGRDGILVRSADGSRLAGFTLRGMLIRDYSFTGVLLDGVDGFRLTGTRYQDNDEYGLFPIRSSGRVDNNVVTGSDDTGVYVGQSSDVLVDGNVAQDNTIGIEIELSTSVRVVGNTATGNSVGLVVQIVPGLPATVTDDVLVQGNVLTANTRPNDVTDPGELLSLVPGGVGLIDAAGDDVTVTGNVITGNPSAGIGVVSLPAAVASLDPRLDPTPDGTRVTGNVFAHNGFDPDPKIAPLQPADVVWDGTGTRNCFTVPRGATTFPGPLPSC